MSPTEQNNTLTAKPLKLKKNVPIVVNYFCLTECKISMLKTVGTRKQNKNSDKQNTNEISQILGKCP